MSFVLSDEHRMLQDAARDFVSERMPVTELRKLRDAKDPLGYSKELWAQMAEMGWAGVVIPEEYGGLDFGYRGLGLILEETGKTLAASPLVSTVLTCGTALMLGGSGDQKAEYLPRIASGEHVFALALEEGPHHNPVKIALKAEKDGAGYVLTGAKTFVLDGHAADMLVVAARTGGAPGDKDGITLFLVDAAAPGIVRERTIMVDSRNAANIHFERVRVGPEHVLGAVDAGYDLLEATLDRARIGLAAEMLGSSQAVFAMTLDYLKERHQFGQPIGTFQALQHRAAKMFCELELTRSLVVDALNAVDDTRNDVAQAASLAKAKSGETFHLIAREGVQMHGGIGQTDEHDVGFYLKRSAVAEATFGNTAYHISRYAALEGY